ncbi:MAG TPA: heavy metal sensor histidine kinase [Terriglobia bacterium]|nr:heavy metal sensor histidine kinase [Terriglobia bacterium]
MRPLTLRIKLTLFYSITVSVLLTGFALVYYRVLSVGLDRDLTQEVIDRTSGLRGYLRFEEGLPAFAYDPNDPDEVSFINTATRYYQVYEIRQGTVLAESDELRASGIQYSAQDLARYAQGPPTLIDVQTDQGKLRLRNEAVPAEGDLYLLVVGASMQSMEDTLNSLVTALAWLIPTGVFLAAVASWFMAGKALKPVAALGKAAGEIAVSSLDRRLPVRGTNDELDQLAAKFNDTLARLENAVGEMKQFTASISHELRTPLAVLRGEAEVALMQANSTEQYRRVLASQLEEFEKLSRMINQLLTLARAESGEVAIAHEPVNISSMTHGLAEQLEPVAASKDVSLSWNCDHDVTLRGDASWFERIILNLVDNAIKFTPPGGHVWITVSGNASDAILEIADDGMGIAPEAVPHIFERFYRTDPSRANRADGAGLGLSLVKWAVDQHHGSIHVESSPGRGTHLTVKLPRDGNAG